MLTNHSPEQGKWDAEVVKPEDPEPEVSGSFLKRRRKKGPGAKCESPEIENGFRDAPWRQNRNCSNQVREVAEMQRQGKIPFEALRGERNTARWRSR